MSKFILYYRVSTEKQGRSGLGLEAQQAAAQQFMAGVTDGVVLNEYTEVETGKNADRPVLQMALQHAKAANATLLVAKLDRLARNVCFVSTLMESKVDFTCCDNPHATPLTIHILAAVAEDEAKRISERTKAALAAAKARGVKLGTHNPKIAAAICGNRGWEKAGIAGRAARAKLQKARYGQLVPVMRALSNQGLSYQAIATYMNDQGYVTSRGSAFSRKTVMRILQRELELTS